MLTFLTCVLAQGKLTSRIWVREMKDRIRFLRPLHGDDIETSDRKFDLVHGKDDQKIALVQAELKRLRHLATLKHPLESSDECMGEEDAMEEVRRRLRETRPRRKFFGM